MKRASPKKKITRAEIEEAMKQFFERGGKITTLPQQRVAPVTVIGDDKWGAYESLRELSF